MTVNLKPSAATIYDMIKETIMSGKLAPGQQLKQDDIAKAHGVSKIPVREALARLEVDGFVLFRKNKGATVREMSADELLQLMDIRMALECKALELAIPNMVADDFMKARSILEKYAKKTQFKDWSDLNIQFHQSLYEPCGNVQLLQMISDVRERMGPHTRLIVSEASGLKRPQSEHYEILDKCMDNDVPKALSLLREHISVTKKETAAKLRRLT